MRLSLGMGGAYTYNRQQPDQPRYRGVVLPRVALQLAIPVSGSVSVETGAGYAPEGFNIRRDWSDSGGRFEQWERNRFQTLTIPLCLNLQVVRRQKWALHFTGGIRYNLLLRAMARYELKYYEEDQLTVHRQSSSIFRTGFTQQNGLSGAPSIQFYLFQPSVTAGLQLDYGRHLGVRLFYDHYLYNAYALAVTRQVRLRSVGLMLVGRL